MGTVGWESKWPREVFSLEEPLWYCEPNYAEVERVARVWVNTKRKKAAAAAAEGAAGGPGAAGWQTFYDALQRPYYFHAATNVTSWVLPEGLGGAPVPPAEAGKAEAAGGEAQE